MECAVTPRSARLLGDVQQSIMSDIFLSTLPTLSPMRAILPRWRFMVSHSMVLVERISLSRQAGAAIERDHRARRAPSTTEDAGCPAPPIRQVHPESSWRGDIQVLDPTRTGCGPPH